MLALAVAVSLAFAADSHAPSAPADGGSRAFKLKQSQSGGFIVNPIGLWVRHDIAVDTGVLPLALGGEGLWGDVRVGAFSQWLVYSNELGVRASYLTRPELLIVSFEGAWEPGAFIEADFGRPPPTDDRKAHVRTRVTAQAIVNLKLDNWWLYSRSTASWRFRDFVEYDKYQDIVVKDTVELEQATAFMWRVARLRSWSRLPANLWWYAEYTVGTLLDVDVRPNRVSSGLIAENFPGRGVGLNLDVFYSFANAPTVGPGMIALYGFTF